MKVAILSDVHGNLPALQAVAEDILAWKPDVTIVNGDLVNRGPSSAECWAFVTAQPGWRITSGNHEAYVLQWTDPDWVRPAGETGELYQPSWWTYERLNGTTPLLATLPPVVSLLDPAGGELRASHASMRGDRDGIYLETEEAELAAQIAPAPRLFCTSHTHRPFVRSLNGTLIVNSGSAGWTFDRDPRASYARLTWRKTGWQAEIVRLEYDREQAARDFVESGYYDGGGPLVRIMYAEWEKAMPLMHWWAADYEPLVREGLLTVAGATEAFLAEHGLKEVRPPI